MISKTQLSDRIDDLNRKIEKLDKAISTTASSLRKDIDSNTTNLKSLKKIIKDLPLTDDIKQSLENSEAESWYNEHYGNNEEFPRMRFSSNNHDSKTDEEVDEKLDKMVENHQNAGADTNQRADVNPASGATISQEELQAIYEIRRLLEEKIRLVEEKNKLIEEQNKIIEENVKLLQEEILKSKEYIKLASTEAVKEALQGDIRALVVDIVRETVTETGKELLVDKQEKSLSEVSENLAKKIARRVTKEVTQTLVEDDGILSIDNDEDDERRKEYLNQPKHQEFQKLLASLKAGLMPMLVGPAGTGKSTAVEQAAYALDLDFYSSNRVQMSHELTGYKDATGNYQPTQFYYAYKNGGVFLLDEIDASSPDALVTINTAMSQGYMNFPNGRVYKHKDFRFAAAGNTYGTGADAQYVGRNELDAATLDRFIVLKWDYDRKLERKIVKDTDLLNFCWKVRDAIDKMKLHIIVSTRGILNAYALSQTKNFTKDEILESVLFEGVDRHNLMTILREVGTSNEWGQAFDWLIERLGRQESER